MLEEADDQYEELALKPGELRIVAGRKEPRSADTPTLAH